MVFSKKSSVFALTCLPFFISCGESDEFQKQPEVDLKKISQNIVFNGDGTYEFHQIHDQILFAGAKPSSDEERRERWQSAIAGYSSPEVVGYYCNDTIDEEDCYGNIHFSCPVQESKVKIGSGSLTSSNRIITAHHVAHATEDVGIIFESIVPIKSFKANFALDFPSENEKKSTLESNVLYDYRLYSLGFADLLTKHSPYSYDEVYRDLKSWDFYLEKDFYIKNNSKFSKDVSILRSDSNSFNLIRSSGNVAYSISKPGMFFDKIDSEGDQSAFFSETREESWATHTQDLPAQFFSKRPSDLDSSQRTQIVSRPGVANSTLLPCKSADNMSCIQDTSGVFLHESSVQYGPNCIGTNHDIIYGSSGGVVYNSKVDKFRAKSYVVERGLYANAVFHAIQAPTDQTPDYFSDWSAYTDEPIPTPEFRSLATVLDQNIVEHAKKERGGDAALLPPMLKNITKSENEDPSPYVQPGSKVPQGCDINIDEDCSEVPLTPGMHLGSNQSVVEETFKCNDLMDMRSDGIRVKQSYVVGILGASSHKSITDAFYEDDSGETYNVFPNLGSLHIICAPWSSSQWSLNWGELVFGGVHRSGSPLEYREHRTHQDQSDLLKGINLSESLPTMYQVYESDIKDRYGLDITYASYHEENEHSGNSSRFPTHQEHDLLVPPAMLMCPPDTVLNGVGVLHRDCQDGDECDDGGGFVIRGIEYLKCLPVEYDDSLTVEEQASYVWSEPAELSYINEVALSNPSITSAKYHVPGPEIADYSKYEREIGKLTVNIRQEFGLTSTNILPIDLNTIQREEIACGAGEAVSAMTINSKVNDPGDGSEILAPDRFPTLFQTSTLGWSCIPLAKK